MVHEVFASSVGANVPCMTPQLKSSIAARWRFQTAGPDGRPGHWHTRVGHYRAMVEPIRHSADGGMNVQGVILRHDQRRQATLYAPTARRGLPRSYRTQTEPPVGPFGDLAPHEPSPRQSLRRRSGGSGLGGRRGCVSWTRATPLSAWCACSSSGSPRSWSSPPGEGQPALRAVEDVIIFSRQARMLLDVAAGGSPAVCVLRATARNLSLLRCAGTVT
jgi:hypothetical protein